MGLRQRNGCIKTLVVPYLEAHTLRGIIRRDVPQGSTTYPDGLWSHAGLEADGSWHEVIERTAAFVRWPNVHTRAIESQWAHTKIGRDGSTPLGIPRAAARVPGRE